MMCAEEPLAACSWKEQLTLAACSWKEQLTQSVLAGAGTINVCVQVHGADAPARGSTQGTTGSTSARTNTMVMMLQNAPKGVSGSQSIYRSKGGSATHSSTGAGAKRSHSTAGFGAKGSGCEPPSKRGKDVDITTFFASVASSKAPSADLSAPL